VSRLCVCYVYIIPDVGLFVNRFSKVVKFSNVMFYVLLRGGGVVGLDYASTIMIITIWVITGAQIILSRADFAHSMGGEIAGNIGVKC